VLRIRQEYAFGTGIATDVAPTDLRSEVTAIKCTEPLSVHTRGGAARRRKPVTRSSRKADITKD